MGNQARVAPGATVFSTSTRNFPQRMGDDSNVYPGSGELAAITAKLGKLPTLNEYRAEMSRIASKEGEIYRYLKFDEIEEYKE
jgi:aconitate hydratase 2/2-methylisocitrate dehydratase